MTPGARQPVSSKRNIDTAANKTLLLAYGLDFAHTDTFCYENHGSLWRILMLHRTPALILTTAVLLCLAACGGADSDGQATAPAISGRVEEGLRVLSVDPAAAQATKYTIYRGDYVRLESSTSQSLTISIPELKVNKTYPVANGEKSYFKVPRAGSYTYTIGGRSGVIEAVEYAVSGYQEVSAQEGAAMISNIEPLILDVRTPGEFESGHLAGALLIPVQVLQAELGRLDDYKNKPVFIYCRSGNRSTVAAKVLMDKGFTNVVNLRGGLRDWQANNMPVVK